MNSISIFMLIDCPEWQSLKAFAKNITKALIANGDDYVFETKYIGMVITQFMVFCINLEIESSAMDEYPEHTIYGMLKNNINSVLNEDDVTPFTNDHFNNLLSHMDLLWKSGFRFGVNKENIEAIAEDRLDQLGKAYEIINMYTVSLGMDMVSIVVEYNDNVTELKKCH